ncbi:transposase [Bacillus gobiensis]
MARIKYSKAEKLAILHLYEDGHHSIADISPKLSVDPGTIRDWKRKYEVNGRRSSFLEALFERVKVSCHQ